MPIKLLAGSSVGKYHSIQEDVRLVLKTVAKETSLGSDLSLSSKIPNYLETVHCENPERQKEGLTKLDVKELLRMAIT